jgi:hypothetical protein
MMRPSRQPCSSAIGERSMAPAARARSTLASGSSTTSSVRPVAPPIAVGLKRPASADAAATQKAASPTASWATTSSPSPTWCRTVAPKAAV